MRQAVIDELVFQAAPLGEQAPSIVPALSIHIPVASAHKGFTHPVPLFARRPPMAPGDAHWPAYCGLLRDVGIPLQTTARSLETLSVANVPLRLAKRDLDEGFEEIELATAEALEIRCVTSTPGGGVAQLPLEAAAWHELKVLIQCLRDLSGGATPIGLGILIGDVNSDVANALATRADFVILELPTTGAELSPAEFDLLVWSIATARSACIQAGVPRFPLYVDASVKQASDVIKLLALGASAVSIDALARECLPTLQRTVSILPQGMLSGIGSLPSQPVPSVKPLRDKLTELVESLRTRLRQLQLAHVGDLSCDHLRAISRRAARLSGARLLAQERAAL